jgi:integrase
MRPASVQIMRRARKDGTTTFSLRVRVAGADETVPLGNTGGGWDEVRVDAARRQLLAKIELGQWTPSAKQTTARRAADEPTFHELATDWLASRTRNPAIQPRTTELNKWQLARYLIPHFGDLRPSDITVGTIRGYRERIHKENEQIRTAAARGQPLRDQRTRQQLRTLSNRSINETLRTLAQVLDLAEDDGCVDANVARGRRVREPGERRRKRGALDVDEFLTLLESADQLDNRHWPRTIERANQVRLLRDQRGLEWKAIGKQLSVAPTTAIYLYDCTDDADTPTIGVRRAIIATLGLSGPRVGELCQLDNRDVVLAKARFHIEDAKTDAGVRTVDIHPRLLEELTAYVAGRPGAAMDAPAFPTRVGTRRDRNNVLKRVVTPALARANELRTSRDEPPIRVHLTPHTFRRSYITFMVAAGFDLPYIQAQVGHVDPSTTLGIYAQMIARSDRDQLRAEIRELLGIDDAPKRSAGVQRQLDRGPRSAADGLSKRHQKAPSTLRPSL